MQARATASQPGCRNVAASSYLPVVCAMVMQIDQEARQASQSRVLQLLGAHRPAQACAVSSVLAEKGPKAAAAMAGTVTGLEAGLGTSSAEDVLLGRESLSCAAGGLKQAGSRGSLLSPPEHADWEMGGVWGIGTVRSLEQLEEYMGICFATKRIQPWAALGGLSREAFE